MALGIKQQAGKNSYILYFMKNGEKVWTQNVTPYDYTHSPLWTTIFDYFVPDLPFMEIDISEKTIQHKICR